MLRTTATNQPRVYRRGVSIALLTLGCAVATGACGGSKSTPTASSDPKLALSQCMRAHGVPSFPDPTKGPGGEGMSVDQSPGSSTLTVEGIRFGGPAFQAAVKTCGFFGGRGGRPGISESQELAELRFSQCMRKHGVPNFPDPEFPSGGGIMRPDVPGLARNSPAVSHAAAVCNNA